MSDQYSESLCNAITTSCDLTNAVMGIVDAQFSAFQKHLVENCGLSEDDVVEYVESFKGTCESSGEPEVKNSKRRMIPPNTAAETVKEKKQPKKVVFGDSDEATLVTNYGAKSHALFGDFGKTYIGFKGSFLMKTKYMKANPNLAFGFGWVMMDKSKLSEVERALEEADIPYRKVERSVYQKEKEGGSVEEEEEEEVPAKKVEKKEAPAKKVEKKEAPAKKVEKKEAPAKKVEKKKEPTKKVEKKVKVKATKNLWGNAEEADSGFIFKMLPIGEKGKNVGVVVGWQDADADQETMKGLDSVFPLDEVMEDECKEKGWLFVNDEIMEILNKKDKNLAKRLQKVREREIDDIEELDDEDLETITLTFGEQAENHAGMQILGGGLADDGFNLQDLEAAKVKFEAAGKFAQLIALHPYGKAARPDLNFDEAYILIIRNGLDVILTSHTSDDLMIEQKALTWDTKALMRGREVNKHARSNLCYGNNYQAADIPAGKGTIMPYSQIPITKTLVDNLPVYFGPKAQNMQAEGNRYFNLKSCYIGFHGDGERKRVIAVRLGASLPFVYQWFFKNDTIGPRISTVINHGDVYIMSEKASGWDWKHSSYPTLRHAAGLEKNTVVIPRLTKLVKKGNVQLMEKLMKEGMSPNNDAGISKNLPIIEAVKKNRLDIVELLIKYGANYDLKPYGQDLMQLARSKDGNVAMGGCTTSDGGPTVLYLQQLGL